MFILFTVLLVIFDLANSQTCSDAVDSSVCRLLTNESYGLKDVCTSPCLLNNCQKTCGRCQPTPAPTFAPISSVAPPAVIRGPCDDFNNELCTQLAFAMPDVCSNDCIASKVCPSLCGKCLTCFYCDDMQHQSECSTRAKCIPGQICFITETYNSMTFQHGFSTGCMDRHLCVNLTSGDADSGTGPAVIGRRSHFHFSLHGECCGSDLCNDRITTTASHIVTTPGPTVTHRPSETNSTSSPLDCNRNGECPPGFHAFRNKCYYFGDTEMEWDNALGYCKERCSHLAELKTNSQLQEVMSHFLNSSNSGYDSDVEYFIGAVDRGVGRWTWFYSGEELDHDLIYPSFHAHKYDHCANVFYENDYDVFDDDFFGIDNVLCDALFRPMCEVIRT